jgi:hypothetical protein
MREMEQVIRGLTRGLPFEALDDGYAAGTPPLSYFPRAHTLGVVLPNNSPGVHSLWIPAIALKTALVLRPGSAEPWSPYRIIQALIKAGVPQEAFHYYPSDHAGGGEIMRTAGRGMIFGDASTMKAYASDPRIEIHGPGFSKIVIGEDQADNWERYLDVMVESIAANSGRSCVNASGVWTPRYSRQIAGSARRTVTPDSTASGGSPRCCTLALCRSGRCTTDQCRHRQRAGRTGGARHDESRAPCGFGWCDLPATDDRALRVFGACASESRVPVSVRSRG